MAQLASVLAWGASGRQFESDYPDFACRSSENRCEGELFNVCDCFIKKVVNVELHRVKPRLTINSLF